jgi:hypothetical protein
LELVEFIITHLPLSKILPSLRFVADTAHAVRMRRMYREIHSQRADPSRPVPT